MGDLSKNFSVREFRCRCGQCDFNGSTISSELIVLLELIREKMSHVYGDLSITINSGVRCPEHNRAVGSNPNSQHLLGTAADIVVQCKKDNSKVAPGVVAEYVNSIFNRKYGIGIYDTFTHIDVRKTQARW